MSTQKEEETKNKEKAKEATLGMEVALKPFTECNLFETIEILYNWATDDFPEKGFYAHISDFGNLMSDLTLAGTFGGLIPNFSSIELVSDESIKELVEAFFKFIDFWKNIGDKIWGTLLRIIFTIAKVAYDFLKTIVETFKTMINGLAKSVNELLLTIGNLIYIIKKLFEDEDEEEKEPGEKKSLWEKFCDKISEMFTQMVEKAKKEWGEFDFKAFVKKLLCKLGMQILAYVWAQICPFIEMAKKIWEQLQALKESLGESEKVLKEALDKFLDQLLGPFKKIIDMVLNALMNSMYYYSIRLIEGSKYKVVFISDVLVDQYNQPVICEAEYDLSKRLGTMTYSLDGGKTKITQMISGEFNIDIGMNEEQITVGLTAPNIYLKKGYIKLLQESDKPQSLDSEVMLKPEPKTFWDLIEEFLEKMGMWYEYLAKKAEAFVNAIVNKIFETIFPFAMTATVGKISGGGFTPPSFSLLTLTQTLSSVNLSSVFKPDSPDVVKKLLVYYPSAQISLTSAQMPKQKVLSISLNDVVGVSQFLVIGSIFKFSCTASWIGLGKKKMQGFIKVLDKGFEICVPEEPNFEKLKLFPLYVTDAGTMILFSSEQFQLLLNLEKILSIPKYLINSIAYAAIVPPYLLTVTINEVLKTVKQTLKVVGLSFDEILGMLTDAMNAVSDEELFAALDATGWPDWSDFPGNPLSGFLDEAIPENIVPENDDQFKDRTGFDI